MFQSIPSWFYLNPHCLQDFVFNKRPTGRIARLRFLLLRDFFLIFSTCTTEHSFTHGTGKYGLRLDLLMIY